MSKPVGDGRKPIRVAAPFPQLPQILVFPLDTRLSSGHHPTVLPGIVSRSKLTLPRCESVIPTHPGPNRSRFTPVYTKPDKTWISCDNNPGSPYYGNCYAEWDNNGAGDIVYLSVSSDGGSTWGTPVQPSTKPAMFALQPLSLSTGRVIAPGSDASNGNIQSTTSTDGGKTFGAPVTVSSNSKHTAAGNLRDLVLPSSAVDAADKVYTVWQDCRFRTGCAEYDLVMSTTTDGTTWSAVTRIPIDPTTSTVDHFLPGLAIEPNTSGSTAHLGLTYYYYPNTSCTKTTCQLEAGYISSTDGGTTWSAPTQLSSAMTVTWFPNTNQGFMPGDYTSLTFVNGLAYPIIGIATANSGKVFNATMNAPVTGLSDGPGLEQLGWREARAELPLRRASAHHTRVRPLRGQRLNRSLRSARCPRSASPRERRSGGFCFVWVKLFVRVYGPRQSVRLRLPVPAGFVKQNLQHQ